MTTLTLDIEKATRPPDRSAPAARATERPAAATRPTERSTSAPRPTDRPAPAARASAVATEERPASLDDLVARTWSSLLVTRAAACLLCGGDVVPRYGSGPHPVGGTCRSCGTEMA